jgi:membrane-associated phospholipid phosphatase
MSDVEEALSGDRSLPDGTIGPDAAAEPEAATGPESREAPDPSAQDPSAPDPSEDEIRWRRIRRRVFVGWGIVVAAIVVFVGVPTDRGSITLLVLSLLAIPCLGKGWRSYLRVLIDWIPFTAVLVIYDYSRGIASRIGMPLHMKDVADADKALFGGTVPTVWLQDHMLKAGDPRWWDAVTTVCYSTHFFATPIIAAVLWIRDRALWVAFISRIIALSLAGLLTYIFFPAAPPWYAAREGVIPPVIRASSRGWLELHINHAGNLVQQGQLASNPVAAMPSLHTAFATIITLFVIRRFRTPWRWLMVLYPCLMGFSLVYMAEHYVVDVVAGVVYALLVDLAIGRWERRRARRRLTVTA